MCVAATVGRKRAAHNSKRRELSSAIKRVRDVWNPGCVDRAARRPAAMGEGEESLEEMLDVFPELQDEALGRSPPSHLHASPSCEAASARGGVVFEGEAPEMMGILTSGLANSWSSETNDESPNRGGAPGAWEDFPDDRDHTHETCSDEELPHLEDRGDASSDHNAGSVDDFAHHPVGNKENGFDHSERRSNRQRKTTIRFDPVNAQAKPRSDAHHATDGGRGSQKRRVKVEVKAEVKEEMEDDDEVESSPSDKRKSPTLPHRLSSLAPSSSRAAKVAVKDGSHQTAPTKSNSRKRSIAALEMLAEMETIDKTERGKHVGSKPQMQKTARAGQRRWKQLLAKMRSEATTSPINQDFLEQMAEVRGGESEQER